MTRRPLNGLFRRAVQCRVQSVVSRLLERSHPNKVTTKFCWSGGSRGKLPSDRETATMRNRATTPLSKAKIRQSWSKYNLYNLQRFRNPNTVNRTFFQQKWTAKSAARAYHGEQVRESQWERMFSRRIRSVVPMDAARLAEDDGSQVSAGRGSGLQSPQVLQNLADGRKPAAEQLTPFMQMAFAPLERRLDTAIFRALFASSARQARQFVVHGAVTVNGKKMRYPGYLLNPGDMFQVDPERVMFATGAPKSKTERRETRLERRKGEGEGNGEAEGAAEGAAEGEGENENAEAKAAEGKEAEGKDAETKEAEAKEEELDTRETLKRLMAQAKSVMSSDKSDLPAKRKQELRGFQKAVRRVLSRSESSNILTGNLETQFSELLTLLKTKRAKPSQNQTKDKSPRPAADTDAANPEAEDAHPGEKLTEAFQKAAEDGTEEVDTSELSDDEIDTLKRALVQMRDNPIDSSKPYATPWRPRDYMSAFAFIPRYLEVNQKICAAVYLRHPVARPGFSEVPSPFSEGINTAAFTWYLKRR